MLPTFSADLNLMIEKSISLIPKLQRGDIITFLKPIDPKISVCKRVIGLPGDVICVDPAGLYHSSHVTVPEGHVWVQGDNSSYSTDSRVYGPLPMGLIKGKIIATVYPNLHVMRNPLAWIN